METVTKNMNARETKVVLFQNATLGDKVNINHISSNPIIIKTNTYIQTCLSTWEISGCKKQVRVKTEYSEDTLTLLNRNQTSYSTHIYMCTHTKHTSTLTLHTYKLGKYSILFFKIHEILTVCLSS